MIMRQDNIGTTKKTCTLSLSTVDVFFVVVLLKSNASIIGYIVIRHL